MRKPRMENLPHMVYGVFDSWHAKSELDTSCWYICPTQEDAISLATRLNRIVPFYAHVTEEKGQQYVVDVVPIDVIHDICYGYQPWLEHKLLSMKMAEACPEMAPWISEEPVDFNAVAKMAADILSTCKDD